MCSYIIIEIILGALNFTVFMYFYMEVSRVATIHTGREHLFINYHPLRLVQTSHAYQVYKLFEEIVKRSMAKFTTTNTV